VTASVGYNIDSFGHAGTLPQLLARSGIDGYVMMRPGGHEKNIDAPAFWWDGVDGTSLLTYRIPYEYSTEGSHEDKVIRTRTAERPWRRTDTPRHPHHPRSVGDDQWIGHLQRPSRLFRCPARGCGPGRGDFAPGER
jgi:Glycosyl hydrolases family 38 N-terminal domain